MGTSKLKVTRATAASLATAIGMASCGPDSRETPRPSRSALQSFEVRISEGPALPAGRGSHAGGIVGGRVIVVGGSTWNAERTKKSWLADSLVYDGHAKQWVPGPSLPHAVTQMMYASDGDSLYLAGGLDGSTVYADVLRIADRDGELIVETLPSLPQPLSDGAAAVVNGILYVVGGNDSSGKVTNSMLALDLGRPDAAWQPRTAPPGSIRAYHGLVADGRTLYRFGGCVVETPEHPVRQVFKDVYRYDVSADRWTRLADLPTAGQGWAAATLDDRHLLLTGRGDTNVYDDVWIIDLRDGSVISAGSLVTPSFGAPLVKLSPDLWWFIGGEPDANKSRTPRVSEIHVHRS